MVRLAVADVRRLPHPSTVVFHCMSCTHWQLDLSRQFVADVGPGDAIYAVAEEHAAHVRDECAGGETGRVKYSGKWVERPLTSDGQTPTGMLELIPLPAWWVTR